MKNIKIQILIVFLGALSINVAYADFECLGKVEHIEISYNNMLKIKFDWTINNQKSGTDHGLQKLTTNERDN
jgi:hypothetical protein